MDSTQFNGAFWLAISASVSAFVVVVIAALNKSKCINVNCCCGLFSCQRDTKSEMEIEEKALELQEIKIISNDKDEDREIEKS
jgi:hypothetical protein